MYRDRFACQQIKLMIEEKDDEGRKNKVKDDQVFDFHLLFLVKIWVFCAFCKWIILVRSNKLALLTHAISSPKPVMYSE